jgi:plastocyanin
VTGKLWVGKGSLPYFSAAMSRNQRIALVVGALAVAVVAFGIARSGGDGGASGAVVTRIRIAGGKVVGGPKDIEAKKGDTVRIVVSADAHDDVHLHGYDIEKKVDPGRPARFKFKADAEGVFKIESHVAENAGRDPLVARLVVRPS